MKIGKDLYGQLWLFLGRLFNIPLITVHQHVNMTYTLKFPNMLFFCWQTFSVYSDALLQKGWHKEMQLHY